MAGSIVIDPSAFRSISTTELARRLAGPQPPLLLDVRRRAAFEARPSGLTGAVPILLDDHPVLLPDVPRERAVTVYCLCSGEASSSRVARWLCALGFRDVTVLEGGLGAWLEAGLPVEPLDVAQARRGVRWIPSPSDVAVLRHDVPAGASDAPFLSRLADREFLRRHPLPLRRHMTVLFVDMADSTKLLGTLETEQVLAVVQAFMEIVAEVGGLHCGDVHDFEGDGALLYFEGAGEALPAAFELRRRLLGRRAEVADLPLPRISLDEGPVVVGIVGSRFRRSVALVGASLPRAARILRIAPPGGIVVTETVYRHALETSPDLAAHFAPVGAPILKGFETEPVPLYVAPP